MAGIEKICEISGEYGSHDMYGYKRDLIQVMPLHRKKFAKAKHMIHIFKPRPYFQYKGAFSRYEINENLMHHYEPPFDNMKDLIDYKIKYENVRLVHDYDYVLCVEEKDLFGNVNGRYVNNTLNIGTMKRKMKRLLKCKKLNIKYHDCSYYEWRKEVD